MIPSRRYHSQLKNGPGLTVGVTVTVNGRLLEQTGGNLFLRWAWPFVVVSLIFYGNGKNVWIGT